MPWLLGELTLRLDAETSASLLGGDLDSIEPAAGSVLASLATLTSRSIASIEPAPGAQPGLVRVAVSLDNDYADLPPRSTRRAKTSVARAMINVLAHLDKPDHDNNNNNDGDSGEMISASAATTTIGAPLPTCGVVGCAHTAGGDEVSFSSTLKSLAPLPPSPRLQPLGFRATTRLYDYQRAAVAAMRRLETDVVGRPVPDPAWHRVTLGDVEVSVHVGDGTILARRVGGEAAGEPDPRIGTVPGPTGFVLCEYMGTGKTLEILALVLETAGLWAKMPPAGVLTTKLLEREAGKVPSLAHLCAEAILLRNVDYTSMRARGSLTHTMRNLLDSAPPLLYEIPLPSSRWNDRRPGSIMERFFLSRATLVVVPSAIFEQWKDELTRHLLPGALTVLFCKDQRPKALPPGEALVKYDLVVITHAVLGRQHKLLYSSADDRGSQLYSVHWKRLVIDEGHVVGRCGTKQTRMFGMLRADARVVCTGTPTPAEDELGFARSLLGLLEEPLSDTTLWKTAVKQPIVADAKAQAEFEAAAAAEATSNAPPVVSDPATSMQWAGTGTDVRSIEAAEPQARLLCHAAAARATLHLQRTLHRVAVRNPEAVIAGEVPLTPLSEVTTELNFRPHELRPYNEIVALTQTNLICSQWTGVDSIADASNADSALRTIANLHTACFFMQPIKRHEADNCFSEASEHLTAHEWSDPAFSVPIDDKRRAQILRKGISPQELEALARIAGLMRTPVTEPRVDYRTLNRMLTPEGAVVTASTKLNYLLDRLAQLTANGQKVIVFCASNEVLAHVLETLEWVQGLSLGSYFRHDPHAAPQQQQQHQGAPAGEAVRDAGQPQQANRDVKEAAKALGEKLVDMGDQERGKFKVISAAIKIMERTPGAKRLKRMMRRPKGRPAAASPVATVANVATAVPPPATLDDTPPRSPTAPPSQRTPITDFWSVAAATTPTLPSIRARALRCTYKTRADMFADVARLEAAWVAYVAARPTSADAVVALRLVREMTTRARDFFAVIDATLHELVYLQDRYLRTLRVNRALGLTRLPFVARTIASGHDLPPESTAARLRSVAVVQYHNKMKAPERYAALQRFSSDPHCRVIVMNRRMAAEGINLTAASHVVFLEPVFQAAERAQAVARAHRIGQTRPVTVETLVLSGTIEDRVEGRRRDGNTVLDLLGALAFVDPEQCEQAAAEPQTIGDLHPAGQAVGGRFGRHYRPPVPVMGFGVVDGGPRDGRSGGRDSQASRSHAPGLVRSGGVGGQLPVPFHRNGSQAQTTTSDTTNAPPAVFLGRGITTDESGPGRLRASRRPVKLGQARAVAAAAAATPTPVQAPHTTRRSPEAVLVGAVVGSKRTAWEANPGEVMASGGGGAVGEYVDRQPGMDTHGMAGLLSPKRFKSGSGSAVPGVSPQRVMVDDGLECVLYP